MKRACVVCIAGLLVVGLTGCWNPFAPPPEQILTLTAKVAQGTLRAAFEAQGYQAAVEYRWDFGDGSPELVTASNVVTHTFPEKSVYPVVVVAVGPSSGGGGGGQPGGPPGRGIPGEGGTKSASVVVDLLGNLPAAVILIHNHYRNPTGDVISYLPVILFGESSSDPVGGGLAYWWEVVRVDPTTLEPIPYPSHADGYQPPIEYIRVQDMNWTHFFRGPGGCGGVPWLYRVRLRVTDTFGRQHEAVKYLRVW